jgi:DNA-binding transcriptional LysR family regulator
LGGEPAHGQRCRRVQATARFAEEVREGGIDIACLSFPVDTSDMVIKPLGPVDFVIVSRRNHPEIKKPLDTETLRRLPQIAVGRELRGLTGVDKSLVAKNMPRRTPYMAAKIWSMPPMIQRTELVGFLPRRFAQEIADNFELDIHESPVEMPEQHIYMMWHVNSEEDAGHKWLRDTMLRSLLTNQTGRALRLPLPG